MKVKLNKVRLSFPDLFEASEYEGTRSYGAAFLVTPGSAVDKSILAAITEVANDKWTPAKAAPIVKAALAAGSQKCCYWDGNTKTYDGYEGMKVLSAKRKESEGRPGVFDLNKSPLTLADAKVYAGCYVNASVEFWAQDNKFGKTVRCTLIGVQFAADGDAFSASSPVSEDDFEDLSEGADAEELV